jgi:hypothetical protein
MPLRRRALWAFAIIACLALLLAPALWNGFPLLQYDTGGYLAPWFDHRLAVNRPVPYGLLLVAGQWLDFWPVLVVQSALTIWVLGLMLRAHKLGGRPMLLLGLIAALSVFTTLPWLTAILLTDIFAGLAILALYLLLLRDEGLRKGERAGLMVLTIFGAATHSGTLVLLIGLTAAAALVRLVALARFPLERIWRAVAALAFSAIFVLTLNGSVTGTLGWAPGGYALSFGRMLQDGIVHKYLDRHCPDASLKLCPYKNMLPRDPDDFFWGGGIFNKLGRFEGLHEEMRRIALASLAEYPWLQLRSVVGETAKQLVMVDTGAGVVSWVWDTYFTIKDHVPAALPAMHAARQQRGTLSFVAINWLDVPFAYLTMALLPVLVLLTWRRRGWSDIGELAATAGFAILGNAAVFGLLATAHNRYGARTVWLAALAVFLALARWGNERMSAKRPSRAPRLGRRRKLK